MDDRKPHTFVLDGPALCVNSKAITSARSLGTETFQFKPYSSRKTQLLLVDVAVFAFGILKIDATEALTYFLIQLYRIADQDIIRGGGAVADGFGVDTNRLKYIGIDKRKAQPADCLPLAGIPGAITKGELVGSFGHQYVRNSQQADIYIYIFALGPAWCCSVTS